MRILYSVQEGFFGGFDGVQENGALEVTSEEQAKEILKEISYELMDEFVDDELLVNPMDYDNREDYEIQLQKKKEKNVDYFYCIVDESKAKDFTTVELNDFAYEDFEDALQRFCPMD